MQADKGSILQDRNEVKVGSMITNKAHPCSAAVDLIAQRGLSWPQAKHNLLARRHPRWHPGEGMTPKITLHNGINICQALLSCGVLRLPPSACCATYGVQPVS